MNAEKLTEIFSVVAACGIFVIGWYTLRFRRELKREREMRKDVEEELRKSRERYRSLSDNLEKGVREEVADSRRNDLMLIQRSRQAAMCEMIGNIAHKWRQPLNAIGLIIQDLEECYDHGDFTGDYLKNSVRQAMEVMCEMSRTISDFRNFFKPDKAPAPFNVGETVRRALNFVAGSFRNDNIRIDVVTEGDAVAIGSASEYSQVILNILDNAREALLERRVTDARIRIHSFEQNAGSVVTITDNAGGIPEDIIDKIFDPYFSTKGPDGNGIGLYISKTIVEHNMKGKLSVSNDGNGAEFRIEVTNCLKFEVQSPKFDALV